MQAIRSTDTKGERILASSLWNLGLRYRKNNKTVFGKPDFTFKKFKIAIFVDGEFFHGRDWEIQKYRIKSNREFWWAKIEYNIKRDSVVINRLEEEGWIVLRFWDKEILKNVSSCVSKIEEALNYSKNSE